MHNQGSQNSPQPSLCRHSPPPARSLNPHSSSLRSCCPRCALRPAISCLGAFRTPAVSMWGWLRHAGIRKPAQFRSSGTFEHFANRAALHVTFTVADSLILNRISVPKIVVASVSALPRQKPHQKVGTYRADGDGEGGAGGAGNRVGGIAIAVQKQQCGSGPR